eukprot:g236.t1
MAGVAPPATSITKDTFPVVPIPRSPHIAPIKVLFIHGGGSRDNFNRFLEPFAVYLKTVFGKDNFTMKNVRMTSDFELCIATHGEEIKRFRPDVVVGRSQGGPTILALIKRKMWLGPSVICCPALVPGLDDHLVTNLPRNVPIVLLIGLVDEQVPYKRVCQMLWNEKVREHLGKGFEAYCVDDIHALKSILNDEKPRELVCDENFVTTGNMKSITLRIAVERVLEISKMIAYKEEFRIPKEVRIDNGCCVVV